MRFLLVLAALTMTPTFVHVARAETPVTAQSLRDRAKKLDADAATDRATADKAKKTAIAARKAAAEKLASAAKLKTQLATADSKLKPKLEADIAALEKGAAKDEDEATQLDGGVITLERRAQKLGAEAKRLRKQADALDAK